MDSVDGDLRSTLGREVELVGDLLPLDTTTELFDDGEKELHVLFGPDASLGRHGDVSLVVWWRREHEAARSRCCRGKDRRGWLRVANKFGFDLGEEVKR